MRKLFAYLLLLSLLAAMLPTASAAQKYVESGYKYTVENGEATIVGYTELPDVLHIPETLGGYPVTAIASDAIWLSTLREVYIPESIRRIGNQAFYSSAGMTVYLPDSNIMFASHPFAGASRVYAHITSESFRLYVNAGALCAYEDLPCVPWELEPITENGLTYALYDGEAILLSAEDAERIEVPETLGDCPVTVVASRCFYNVSGDAGIVLPDSVRHIGYAALSYYAGYRMERLPSSLEYLGPYALANLALTNQTLPDSLRFIGDYAFSGCDLPNLELNEGLEYIGSYAFSTSVRERTDLTIPESVKYIGENAFAGAKLRLSVLSRDAQCTDAFGKVLWVRGYGESSIMCECGRAGVPFEDLETGERYEFSYKTTVDGMTYRVTEDHAELLMQDSTAIDTVVHLPEKVDGRPLTVIRSGAFDHNDFIEAVFLPDTVEIMEDRAFDSCPNLYYIRMSNNIRQIQQNAVYSCNKFDMIYLPPSFAEYKTTGGDKEFVFGYRGKSARIVGEEGSFAQAVAFHFDYTFIKAREGYDYISLPSGVYETDGKTATMIAVRDMGSDNTLVVPDEVFGIPITRIASGLIYPDADNDIGYETIVLGNNIISVGEGAFSRSYLRYLHLGRNVQSLPYPLLNVSNLGGEYGIYGYADTYAETFAKQHGYKFYPYDSSPFTDVSRKAWYHDAVSFCYWRNLLNGTSATTFEPEAKTTRAMVAQILFNLSGQPYLSWSYGFRDIDSSDWFYRAVNWCRYYGLAYGTSTWYFSPNDYVTREQVATFFYRYAEVCGLNVSAKASLNGYWDAWRVSDYAKSALQWAVANKIMVGNSPTTLNPKGYATRAEIAMIIMNFANYVSAQ